MKLSIVLPTFNEVENIEKLIETISITLKHIDHEIIVVDDNSSDNTYQKVLAIKNDSLKAYQRKKDRGLAKSIRFGIDASHGELICVMDADFSHNPKYITELINQTDYSDIAWGSRFINGGGMAGKNKKIQKILSYILNKFLIKTLLKLPINDTTNGFYVIKKNVLDELDSEKDKIFYGYGDYAFRLSFYLKLNNKIQTEYPVIYDKRMAGQAKTKIINVGSKYMIEAVKLLLRKK